MNEIDELLAKLPADQKRVLEQIRKLVIKTVPDATEGVSYGMPGFKYKGKYLVAYWGFKDHMSIFPGAGAIDHFAKELSGYVVSKGTIQFTENTMLPDSLIIDILRHRVKDIEG